MPVDLLLEIIFSTVAEQEESGWGIPVRVEEERSTVAVF